MAAILVKVLLVASVLYVASPTADASFSKVASFASAFVERTVKTHTGKNVFSNQQIRSKREVVTKTLEDPKGCLNSCRSTESTQMGEVILNNTAILISVLMESIKASEDSKTGGTPKGDEFFDKLMENKLMSKVGPLFQDMCSVYTTSAACYSKCSDSKARAVLTYDNVQTQSLVCEPGANWKNFSDFFKTLNCTNSTELEKACENKCGPDENLKNVTHLHIVDVDAEDDKKAGVTVKYESDSKKNTVAAKRICKNISCQVDCIKPIVTAKCGAKTYDFYNRLAKADLHGDLGILKTLGAVDAVDECKAYL